jgi:acyl carrier protein
MPRDTSTTIPDRARIAEAVKRLVVTESRLSIDPSAVPDGEPLNGRLLKVNSLGFLGMLIHLEDNLGITLPDDLFVGHSFETVQDLIDLVVKAAEGAE